MLRLSPILLLTMAASATAGELRLDPPSVSLRPPHATQQLIVSDVTNGRATSDRTANGTFVSSNPGVATVSPEGVITAVGDGNSTITATVEGQTATVAVTVAGMKSKVGWDFERHVIPTLTRTGCNSGACHGALAGKGGFKLSLRGFDPESDWFAMTRQAQARRTDAAALTNSLLLKKATKSMPHGGGTRFTDDSPYYDVLKDWIAAGAKGPAKDRGVTPSLAVYPPAMTGSPKQKARLIVVATYPDGHTEDITNWAKFSSSEESVAGVDEEGTATIAGHGVAGLSVVFGSSVATATVTVPFPNRIDASALTESPQASLIDVHVLQTLRILNLPPSPAARDAEYARRAFLDACGILPTPNELDDYVKDASSDKKRRLVDSLLARPEFTDYWAYRWSDLFLVSTRTLPQAATWSFYRSIRRAVADNTPWDRFARDILTASGSTLNAGPTNYYVLHKDVATLAETTSVTFLGTSIGCAKCHNHPLEKWTQDEYWAFANLFSRVSIKNGDAAGESIVAPSSVGEALHPRRGVPMPPAPLGGKALPLGSTNDRRAYFADWLTNKDNPFFAKAIVNRVWKAYMGRGLVEAEDDLRATNPASNPALFDALAKDFVDHGYDLRRLMRQILMSDAYGRSSTPLAANAADDRFYSRYFVRRLPAEVILDAYASVTGVPTPFDEASAGPSNGFVKKTDYPRGTRAVQLPDTLLVSRFLDQFGRPERQQACACERTADSSIGQALHVSNGQTLNDKLRDEKSVVKAWLAAKLSDEEIVSNAFTLALGRNPTSAERKTYAANLAVPESGKREAVEDVLWALLTGREFLFNH